MVSLLNVTVTEPVAVEVLDGTSLEPLKVPTNVILGSGGAGSLLLQPIVSKAPEPISASNSDL